MKQGSKWRTFCRAFICWTVSPSFGLIAYTQTVSLVGILKSIFKVGFAMNDLGLVTEFNDNSVYHYIKVVCLMCIYSLD